MAGSEPVTSPDQRKPGNRRAARIAGVISILVLVAMAALGNHDDADSGLAEDLWLFGFAGLLAAIIIGDAVLRRNGLRR